MAKDITMTTSRASLCALGEYLKRHCFFAPLREQVQIPQKAVRYRPSDKLLDGLLGILCGAKTRSCPSSLRVNTRGLPGDRHKGKKAYKRGPSLPLSGPLTPGDAL